MEIEKLLFQTTIQQHHLVKKMFEEYATGLHSMEDLRLMANKEGLRSKRGYELSKSHIEKILGNPFYYGYMLYNGILYRHIHPTLISKDLFDECQEVRSGRRKTKSKRTQQPFVLKGMLKCQHCACSYSPELKKGRYVYMRPTKSKGECSYCYHLNENAVLSQIEDVLKGMKIPQHILNDVADELKKSSDKEHQQQVSEGVRLQQQYQTLQTRIKRARELYLDASIAKEEFDEMMTGLQVERQNVEARLQRLSNADNSFNKNVMTIFELASKAHDLFKSSELEEKRRIIALVFPNLEMNSAKLVFTLRKPFDMMMNVSHRQEWLPTIELIRTQHYSRVKLIYFEMHNIVNFQK